MFDFKFFNDNIPTINRSWINLPYEGEPNIPNSSFAMGVSPLVYDPANPYLIKRRIIFWCSENQRHYYGEWITQGHPLFYRETIVNTIR